MIIMAELVVDRREKKKKEKQTTHEAG